ncbi:retrovirus-related Pol polyprotein from transposon 412 [Procambarus clarkii]|uniref:retrovirus-related Pol polyprotein from transposon 412 n=1 Tax=Procambarus clarkii TaxID=6728 RepID=UPI003744AB94
MQGEVQVAIREKPFPMSGVQRLLGNDLAEDLQPANLIITEDPQRATAARLKPTAGSCSPRFSEPPTESHTTGVPKWFRHYRTRKLKENDDWANIKQLVVPNSLRPDILRLVRGSRSHYGFYKTYKVLKQDYYWPGMIRDIKHLVKNCHMSQMTGKPNAPLLKAPLIQVPVSSEPFSHTINCDKPLSQTGSGNGPLCSIPCSTPRYSTAVSVQNSTAANVVKHLEKLCPQYGHRQKSHNKCDTISSNDLSTTTNITKVLENLQSSTLAKGTPSHRREMGSGTIATIIRAEPLDILFDVQHNVPSNLLGYNFNLPSDFNILRSLRQDQFSKLC